MDEMVFAVQQWLNATYGSNPKYLGLFPDGIEESGKTGQEVEEALIAALQIELNIDTPTGSFGPATMSAFTPMSIRADNDLNTPTNKEYILQGGFWCKGYNPGGFTGIFSTGTQAAVKKLQSDAGLSVCDGVVDAMLMKAILNTDPFILDANGDSKIRQIQQNLNNQYNAYTGILPTNGIYVRQTNTALIFALQCEEGLSTSVATGTFGPTTISKCPTLSLGDSRTNYVKLLQYSLYVNDFDPGAFDGQYDSDVESAVSNFQSFMVLPVTGVANMATIKGLMTSNGDPNRDALACDTATILTSSTAQAIKNAGFDYVGRYLTGTVGGTRSKAMTNNELQAIFGVGLKVFPIYEDGGYKVSYFSGTQGYVDARTAISTALELGFPIGTTIYFAVDFDALDADISNKVIPYFKSIKYIFDLYSDGYQIGVYGARNICQRVSYAGYADKSFVADMSTGWSGNLGFIMPNNWSFDQFNTITVGNTTLGYIEVDMNGYSGRDSGTYLLNTPTEIGSDTYHQVNEVTALAMEFVTTEDSPENPPSEDPVRDSNYLVTNYYRRIRYGNLLWVTIAGGIKQDFIDFANHYINEEDRTPIDIRDPLTGNIIGIEHLMATISVELYANIPEPGSTVEDFGGWAGDLITVYKDVLAHKDDSKYGGDVYSCAIDYIAASDNTYFSDDDLYGDVDGANIAKILRDDSNKLISSAILEYYFDGSISKRFSKFYEEKFNSDVITLHDKAYEYLLGTGNPSIVTARGLLLDAYDMQAIPEEDGEELIRAFAYILTTLVDGENS